MYQTIKKFLVEGGKCLLIENGKLIGVILTMEEYDKLKSEVGSQKSESDLPPQTPPYQGGDKKEVEPLFMSDINSAGDITLEDLGLDELPY